MEITYIYKVFLLCAITIVLPSENNANSAKLYDHLFNGNYVNQVRPVINNSKVLDMNIKFLVRGISDFDEVSGQLSLMAALDVRWDDEFLHWNISEFPVETLVVSEDEIWTPKLTVANPTDRLILFEEDTCNVRIKPQGTIIYVIGGTITSTCIPNVELYPYDIHRCKITVVPLNYIEKEIKLSSVIDKSLLEQLGEWTLGNLSVHSDTFAEFFSSVTLELNIRRKPDFPMMSIIIPIFLLGLMSSLVFLLPVESGERVSFSITVLLSFAVFLSIVSTMMPKNSHPVPVLCYVLIAMMIFSGLIMLCVILNLRLFYKGSKPAPKCFQVLFQKHCQEMVRNNGVLIENIALNDTGAQNDNNTPSAQNGNGAQNDNGMHDVNGELHGNEEISREPHDVVTWIRVSEKIDIVCCMMFTFLYSVTIVGYSIKVTSGACHTSSDC